jgi:drug/metabolite transporter (DMT)-like permease
MWLGIQGTSWCKKSEEDVTRMSTKPSVPRSPGMLYGVLSALLFGVSAPLSKKLVPEAGPVALAALLYLGAGLSLTLYRLATPKLPRTEAPIRKTDVPKIALMTLSGGVVAPVLLLYGLERVSGVVGSLLLNLEQAFTILIAVVFLKDHLGFREGAGAILLIVGAAVIAWRPGVLAADLWGAAAISAACLGWALDNALTDRLSLRDPIALTQIKSLVGGALNALLALGTLNAWPSAAAIVSASILGILSYGVSIVLAIHAVRAMGAARQAALAALSPFAGALVSIPVLGETPGGREALAGGLLALGVVLMALARHGHAHVHGALEHEHLHEHDEHHRHTHDGLVAEPHSHWHRHEPMEHDHPHLPDAHHRHRH